jgi:hypothetical protein
MFKKPAYYENSGNTAGVIGYDPNLRIEENVRINLADPNVQKIFQYITAFNPPDSLGRIKGRININTAPWFVLAQLPWVGLRNELPPYDANALAKAIVAYRDKVGTPDYSGLDGRKTITGIDGLREIPGFASIGELTTVINQNALLNDYSMWFYALGGKTGDQIGYPDLTSGDGVADDFEERNLFFARISDLVTVRSDVFTAYILIRLGENGPQRRVMAILDRSGYPSEPVRVIALQSVPDAR